MLCCFLDCVAPHSWSVATVVSMEEEAILVRFNDFPVAVEETITKEDAANRVRTIARAVYAACNTAPAVALCLRLSLTPFSVCVRRSQLAPLNTICIEQSRPRGRRSPTTGEAVS